MRVRLKTSEDIKVRLKPQQSIKLKSQNVYVYDPSLIEDYVSLAEDWATKTDGLVDETDYSAKAYAVGGTGTETNNAKYYAGQASNSASAAATSETNAGVSESNALTYATNAGNSATLASSKASEAADSATTATTQAGIAISNAALAKQWAIGDPSEPQGNSAKYWADQAASISLDLANKDLSNLSAAGKAKFAAKQDVISDLAIIRSGAALGATAVQSVTTGTTNGTIKVDGNAVSVYGLGSAAYTASTDYDAAGAASTAETSAKNYADSLASNYATAAQGAKADTAVQPSDLATVATTGDYDDLIDKPSLSTVATTGDYDDLTNKPIIPTVNNATLTITQGGISKGTFTANASSDVTIALDSGGGGAVWGGISGDIDNQTDLKDALDAKADVSSLATVATTGDYDDLINKPTIPAAQVNSDWTANTGVAQILNKPTLGTMAAESASDYTKTSGLATVATSGSYNDLLNKPTIPAAQVNSDWNADSGVAKILNKPSLATVATSGAYSDLSGTPTIPTVNNPTISFTQGGVSKGSITLNQATDQTIALDAGGGGGSYTAGTGIDITSDVISVTAPTLTNTATGTDSLTILGTVGSGVKSVNIGELSSSARNGVAIGYQAQNTGSYNVCVGYNSSNSVNFGYSVALGGNARTTASYAIQLGYGTNSEANSFYVATSSSNNWKMLGSDGLIPSARLPIVTSVSSSSTNSETVGAKLFYDTCGDIETLINAL